LGQETVDPTKEHGFRDSKTWIPRHHCQRVPGLLSIDPKAPCV
jgi:hypothetical protein